MSVKYSIRVWVSNQPEGVGGDCTGDYLRAANAYRTVDAHGGELEDDLLSHADPEKLWVLFREVREVVASVGHGDTDLDDELGLPDLTAHLESAEEMWLGGAVQTLQQLESQTALTWKEWTLRALVTVDDIIE